MSHRRKRASRSARLPSPGLYWVKKDGSVALNNRVKHMEISLFGNDEAEHRVDYLRSKAEHWTLNRDAPVLVVDVRFNPGRQFAYIKINVSHETYWIQWKIRDGMDWEEFAAPDEEADLEIWRRQLVLTIHEKLAPF